MKYPTVSFLALLGLFTAPLQASLSVLQSLEDKGAAAEAVLIGRVVGLEPYWDADSNMVWTRAVVRVDEAPKGRAAPAAVELRLPGGVFGELADVNGSAPTLQIGERRAFFLERGPSDRLVLVGGAAGAVSLAGPEASLHARARAAARGPGRPAMDLSRYAVDGSAYSEPAAPVMTSTGDIAGLLLTNGVPGRYLPPDIGASIPYLVDADALPPGITLEQALQAVKNAFAAWSAVTLIDFHFEGIQSFGTHAPGSGTNDGRIRVQLHDLYNFLSSPSTLGFAGSQRQVDSAFPNGGGAGRVKDLEFHRSVRGYVVLNHRSNSMQNATVFEQVLCHEIGHVLGINHSSEAVNETDPYLLASMMFYQLRDFSRGATLGEWEVPVLRKAQPHDNTPPYVFSRTMASVNSALALANPQVNWARVGYDLQGDELSNFVELVRNELNGSFAVVDGVVRFTPNRTETTPFEAVFSRFELRLNDGINLSPPITVIVNRYQGDSHPAGAPDGLPDAWMVTHFGSAIPVAGYSGPNDDPDGDGQTNLEEYMAGTNPLNANSSLKVIAQTPTSLQWVSRNRGLYRVETSTDLNVWHPTGLPVIATGATASSPIASGDGPRRFFRVRFEP
jgi:hypothetical protein